MITVPADKKRAGKGRRHPGVQLREPRDRQPTWVARFKDPDTGKMRDVRLTPEQSHAAEARHQYARKLSEDLQARRYAIRHGDRAHQEAGITVPDALKRYFQRCDLSPKAVVIYRAAADELEQWCADLGIRTVRQLTKPRLGEYRDWLRSRPKMTAKRKGKRGERIASKKARSPHSINKDLRALSAILNELRGIDVVRLSSDDIADSLKRIRAETNPKECLQGAEIQSLLSMYRGTRLDSWVRFAILTGIRAEESLLLEWRDVREHEIRLRAEVAKQGKYREVPLKYCPTAMQGMTRGEPHCRLFPGLTYGMIRMAYEAAGTWEPHGLRRTYASYLTALAGPFVAAKACGHGVLVMERSYARVVQIVRPGTTLEDAMGLEV